MHFPLNEQIFVISVCAILWLMETQLLWLTIHHSNIGKRETDVQTYQDIALDQNWAAWQWDD